MILEGKAEFPPAPLPPSAPLPPVPVKAAALAGEGQIPASVAGDGPTAKAQAQTQQ